MNQGVVEVIFYGHMMAPYGRLTTTNCTIYIIFLLLWLKEFQTCSMFSNAIKGTGAILQGTIPSPSALRILKYFFLCLVSITFLFRGYIG